MQRFLQYLFDGLSQGSVYALLALGLVIIYRGTGLLNFAHGEMALFCTYLTWQLHTWGIPVVIAVLLGMVAGFAIGALTEVALVRTVAKRSEFAVFIVTIALFLGFNWLCGAIWGGDPLPKGATGKSVSFPVIFPSGRSDFIRIAGATWRYKYLGVLLVVLVLAALLWVLFNRTRVGLAMRAVASNAESSKLVGIKTSNVLMFSWGLAVAIGALGGFMVAGLSDSVSQGMMLTVFLYAAAAATLGGLDSPGGAVLSGLFLGVVESMTAGYQPTWIGSEMKQTVA
ncbi:MAG TPA: branched-chain amino acid ABC transporter permease, partial [Ilumatobacteraceae bacterium]|nr:branched-chain amino acid ABC transporter permease [Ilumatobacteraceae bacterium]